MIDFKWHYDNDPDRLYEEKNFMAYLDHYFSDTNKGFGKGIRDTAKNTQVIIINQSTAIKKEFKVKEIIDVGSNYWYHHKRFVSSKHSGGLLRLLKETLDVVEPKFSDEYYKEYYT